jgi:NAD(P)H dehydrogenase (quinone)
MPDSRTLLVTGASGQLGRRAVELLLATRADRIVAATRHPEKLADLAALGAVVRRADFDDDTTLDEAFAGVDRMLLISTDAMDRPSRRGEQAIRAIEAAERAGVKHVVYTSLAHPDAGSPVLLAEAHRATEAALEASGMSFTSLRNNLYTDILLYSLPRAVATGQLFAATGDGAAAYVTREDCARIAAAALASSSAERQTVEVTGPTAVTHAQIAAFASEITSRPVAYIPLSADEIRGGMLSAGMPAPVVELMVSLDLGIAAGRFGPATNAVSTWTGQPPTSVADFLTSVRALLLGASS